MEIIENFAELSEQEQRAFAEAIIKTINSESTFSSFVDFQVTGVEADDMSGCLFIETSHTDTLDVERFATWTCLDEDDKYSPEDPEYKSSIYEDAEKTFKTKEATIDGYYILINDIADVDSEEIVDVEVDNVSYEDAGIGSYEYWGHMEYDSQPYIEVEGTIIEACSCIVVFEVGVADISAPIETSED